MSATVREKSVRYSTLRNYLTTTTRSSDIRDSVQRDRYVDRLIEFGSSVSLPELCGRSLPDAMYRVNDRGGLGVVAVPDRALDDRQRGALRLCRHRPRASQLARLATARAV